MDHSYSSASVEYDHAEDETTEGTLGCHGSTVLEEEGSDDDDEITVQETQDFVPPPSSWFEQSHVPAAEQSSPLSKAPPVSLQQPPLPPVRRLDRSSLAGSSSAAAAATAAAVVTHPSPSWKELSSQVLPAAARELLSSSLRRMYHTARLSYSKGRWHRRYSDMGHNAGGFAISSASNLDLPHDHGLFPPPPPPPPHQRQTPTTNNNSDTRYIPPFSSLPWVDRQLVKEWRTYLPKTPSDKGDDHEDDDNDDDDDNAEEEFDFERARTLVPRPLPRPTWQKAEVCFDCHKPFGPTRLRHHCRFCGRSFCQSHSSSSQRLPHFGYDPSVPERVCDACERMLEEQNLAERVAWRLARCRDYQQSQLTPYFETGVDSAEDVALRVTRAALAMAKSLPLGAQATVAVETVDVLRKYGLQGIYGIMLRQEFLAAADLLRKALGINKTSWPLSVHELSAAIFYALAQHRAMRGLYPEREQIIHKLRPSNGDSAVLADEINRPSYVTPWTRTEVPMGTITTQTMTTTNETTGTSPIVDSFELSALAFHETSLLDQTDNYNPELATIDHLHPHLTNGPTRVALPKNTSSSDPRRPLSDTAKEGRPSKVDSPGFTPVCDPVPDVVMSSLVFYAPIALNFIYAEKEVDMQLLAAQQGWRLLYAYLHQDKERVKLTDRPASALFVHQERKIVCLSIRGTATINDVITDIRQVPVPFPDNMDSPSEDNTGDGDWTNVFHGQGLALCGMASAAVNLFREHIDSLMFFAKKGYRIRLVGHSLGGGVATLMGVLVLKHLECFADLQDSASSDTLHSFEESTQKLKVYAYGTPSCMDAKLAESVNSFVTTVVLHDDVFPRLTPTSCRGLLKHLLHIRETWVKVHIEEDLRAVGERAKTVWAPRLRQNFTLGSSPSSIKKYCKTQMQRGKKKLLMVKDKTIGGGSPMSSANGGSQEAFADPSTCTSSEVGSIASDPSDWGERFFVPTADISDSFDDSIKEEKESDECDPKPEPQLLLEFLGAGDNETEGLVIDGDEFFETEESLEENVSEGFGLAATEDDPFFDPRSPLGQDDSFRATDSWSTVLHSYGDDSPRGSPLQEKPNDELAGDIGPEAVVLEENPLPRMFVPGKVVHIYSHRGVYQAAYVPRTFRELRRISLAGNMLANHTTKAYFEGLLEVQTARNAPETPPRWTAFDEDDTCNCCRNRFTWASTSNSQAQEARDKHNCRSCGGLVCDPCAKNRVPIPSIGLTVPVRVCDRCYNDIMGGVSAASSSVASSFLAVEEDDRTLSDTSPGRVGRDSREERPQRRRQKRSEVVDDLVSQMKSSALTQHL